MSYGAYVNNCIDDRLRTAFGTVDRKRAALKFASDNFPDYPERRVYEVLLEKRWPARPVSVGEVFSALRECVPASERRAWLTERSMEAI